MNTEYITISEVQRVCQELGLRDWTTLTKPEVSSEEAALILSQVNTQGMDIPLDDFRLGLEVELEHGLVFEDANVTNNHPLLTGKIVLAHLKEMMDYYTRLEVAELEGDLLKAAKSNNPDKVLGYYRRLVAARLALSQREAESLS